MRSAAPLVVLALVLAGCASSNNPPTTGGGSVPCIVQGDAAAPAEWKEEDPRVKLATNQGDMVAALDMERAPITVSNFLNLTRSGYYDGKTFYRVVPGFVIQGGSRTGAPDKVPDEFNPTLRHAEAGILSMATAGPDTGSSEFFITLDATTSLDDRHAVFGRLVEGLDVAHKIAALAPPGQPQYDGPPTQTVTITKAEVIAPAPFEAKHEVDLHPVIAEKKAEAGRAVTFAVILKNKGDTRDAIGLAATVPEGWTCTVNERPAIPAGTARVVFLKVTPAAGATGTSGVGLTAISSWPGTASATGEVRVVIATLGAQVKDGDAVEGNYAGFLRDGRLFDTSLKTVADDPKMPKFDTEWGYQARPASQYTTFDFTVGGNVIAGFTKLAKTAKVGETVTMHIPAADAYARGNMYQAPLTGRDLVFELEIVKVG